MGVRLSHGPRPGTSVEAKGWCDRMRGSREQNDLATALLKGKSEPLPHAPRPEYRHALTRHATAPLGGSLYQRARPPRG